MLSTVIGGRVPGRESLRARFSTRPSSASSRSRSFSRTLEPPLILNAFASSLLPARSGFSSINLRISSLLGINCCVLPEAVFDFAEAARRSVLADRPVSEFGIRRAKLLLLCDLALGLCGRFLSRCFFRRLLFTTGRFGGCFTCRCFFSLGIRGLFRNQCERFFECYTCRIFALWQGRIHFAPIYIRSITSVTDRNCSAVWMVAQRCQCCWCCTSTARAFGLLISKSGHGPIDTD